MNTIYCHCCYAGAVPEETKHAVLRGLCASGEPFLAVPDLCETAAVRDPAFRRETRGAAVAACYPRCLRWLDARAGDGQAPPEGAAPTVLNMREQAAADILQALRGAAGAGGEAPPVPPAEEHQNGSRALEVVVGTVPGLDRYAVVKALLDSGYRVRVTGPNGAAPARGGPRLVLAAAADGAARPEEGPETRVWYAGGLEPAEIVELAGAVCADLGATRSGAWVPWFPVIDYDRCTDCRKCLNFCLFGVFAEGPGGTVEVRNPEKCKTKCPACARVCPQVAIIFPKYKAGPLSGGEEAAGEEEQAQVDIASLVSGDVYAALRARSGRARFGTERDEDRALEERRRCACMADLGEKLDVPPEVLASLSPAEVSGALAGRKKPEPACACSSTGEGEGKGDGGCECDCDCTGEADEEGGTGEAGCGPCPCQGGGAGG
jgi:NAD-dependent dihydropyrimidine dehydrogenase PreA subunit